MIPLKDTNIVEIIARLDASEAFVDINNLLVYSEEEQNTIFKPYLDFLQSLPGYVSLTVDKSDPNFVYKEILFDTCEHAIAAARRLYGEGRDPIVKRRDEFAISKQNNPKAFDRRIFVCKEPFSKTIGLGKLLPGIL